MTDLARALTKAHRSGDVLEWTDAAALPTSLEEAEAFQDKIIEATTMKPAGWKLGATSHAARGSLGLDRAFSGLIPTGRLLQSGASLSRSALRPSGVECELMAVMAKDLPSDQAPFALEAIQDAILGIGTGIEVPQARFPSLGIYGGLALVADNGAAGWGVAGEVSRKASDLDDSPLEARLEVDGEVVAKGDGSAFVAPPLELVRDHVNRMARRGRATSRGEVILIGSLMPLVLVERPARVVARIAGFGECSLSFTA